MGNISQPIKTNSDTVTTTPLSMKKDYDQNSQCQNKYGEWVPAIPEAFWSLFYAECQCGKRFYGFDRVDENYRGHFALKHILGL